MKFLLDTHIILWWSLGNERLSRAGRALLADDRNICVVSVASVWEIAIKSSQNRGLPVGVTAAYFCDLVAEAGFDLQDVSRSYAEGIETLSATHGDPFDRLLVSHARIESLTLLTHDKILGQYGDFVMVV